MAENLQGFFAISVLPFDIKQNQLNNGSGLFHTPFKHKASRHKSCRTKSIGRKNKESYHHTVLGKQGGQAHLALASAKVKKKSCASFAIKPV